MYGGLPAKNTVYTGGVKDHNFLDTRVDPNNNYIFRTLTLN